jgi:hypothetical protein
MKNVCSCGSDKLNLDPEQLLCDVCYWKRLTFTTSSLLKTEHIKLLKTGITHDASTCLVCGMTNFIDKKIQRHEDEQKSVEYKFARAVARHEQNRGGSL